ncbi:MAG: N-carbamoylputrescine amidase [Parvibaculum sp.]|uniref:N-carbamoylputrescine amidase n=1 Tax=Parvibaculum sp. TaxID=2024848 RepID=UPI002845D9F5|nr:N-carbamoylputrescine amidase [Parvibaculum sp.]MDR3499155.1 N-carbamoylputrescine amidase [Parvibaculum sp.]
MSEITVAATQMACGWDRDENIARAEKLVRAAAERGARLILLQELFETPYFCKDTKPDFMHFAIPVAENPAVRRMRELAAELGVILPVSIYERANNALYNSLVMVDAGGDILGVYRKSHIPDGPGYREKYYFNPGDTGFRVWNTRLGRIGAAICWDQWFPETARILALKGADVILYPTAIGSEPHDETIHSRDHWQRTMQGHAAANLVPVVASNRIGREEGESCAITFYGSSFITDATGAKVAEADETSEAVLTASFDIEANRRQRVAWGIFRDRRVDLYRDILSHDGEQLHPAHGLR